MNPENSEELEAIRDAMRYEDGLLNNRTALILTFNGLMAIATAFSGDKGITLAKWLALIVFLLDVLWLLCALEAWCVIREFRKTLEKMRESHTDQIPLYERLQREAVESWACIF